jgi:hypothetical protein
MMERIERIRKGNGGGENIDDCLVNILNLDEI